VKAPVLPTGLEFLPLKLNNPMSEDFDSVGLCAAIRLWWQVSLYFQVNKALLSGVHLLSPLYNYPPDLHFTLALKPQKTFVSGSEKLNCRMSLNAQNRLSDQSLEILSNRNTL